VPVGHEALPLGQVQYSAEEPASHVGAEQTVAIDAEDGAVPHRIAHARADEPAEQQVVVELLDQLLRSLRIVKRICTSSARSSCSGGIDGRPVCE